MSIEVAIVGGGQAGLATSYHLRQAGVEHVVLEAGPSIGGSWSRRWDTLTLFTPAGFSNLPGLPFPADSDSYPGKDDVAQYLQRYASAFELPVRTNQRVTLLRHAGGRFRIETGTGDWTARWVIIATGAFGAPWKPGLAADLGEVRQLHADLYRRPSDIPPGRVVIVGAGNTGSQLALELAQAGREVVLAGRATQFVPQRLLGRDLFWWLTRTGIIQASASTRLGRDLRANPVIGTTKRMLREAGVTRGGRVLSADGDRLRLEAGAYVSADTVLWATGYRHDDRWIDIPGVHDEAGVLILNGFDTPAPGLKVIGRPWQRTRGSALLGYVGADARILRDQVTAHTRAPM